MEWAEQCPDLNPIELILKEMNKTVKEKQLISVKHEWKRQQETWNEEYFISFAESVKQLHCAADLPVESGHFD